MPLLKLIFFALQDHTHTFCNTDGDVRELDFRFDVNGMKIGAPFHGVQLQLHACHRYIGFAGNEAHDDDKQSLNILNSSDAPLEAQGT